MYFNLERFKRSRSVDKGLCYFYASLILRDRIVQFQGLLVISITSYSQSARLKDINNY